MNSLFSPLGIRIITNPYLVDRIQVRFPRTKKRRIQKKWQKQEKNFTYVPSTTKIYRMGDTIICHPIVANQLINELKKREEHEYNRFH